MKFSEAKKIAGDSGMALNIASMFVPGLGEIKLLRHLMNFQNDLSGIRQDITGIRDIMKGDFKGGILSIGTGILSIGGGGLSHFVDRGEGFGGLTTLGRTEGGGLLDSYRSMTSASTERKLFTEEHGDIWTREARGKLFNQDVNRQLQGKEDEIQDFQKGMRRYDVSQHGPLDNTIPDNLTRDHVTELQKDIEIARNDQFAPDPSQSDKTNNFREKMFNSARKNFIGEKPKLVDKYTALLDARDDEQEYQRLFAQKSQLKDTLTGFRRNYIGRTEYFDKYDEQGLIEHFQEQELDRNVLIKKIIFRKTLIISAARTGAYAATITNNYAITNKQ
jgi:hypothetical protein